MGCRTEMKEILSALGLYDLSDTSYVSSELAAYALGLEIIETRLWELERNIFFQTASHAVVTKKLSFFPDISYLSSTTNTADRRVFLSRLLSVKQSYNTVEGVVRCCWAVGVNVRCSMENSTTLAVEIIDGPTSQSPMYLKKRCIIPFLPAHLQYTIT